MTKPKSLRFDTEVKETKIIGVTPSNPEIESVEIAADIIKNGGTVAFPTETVYGIGADALNSEAVMKIYKAKERPPDNPIIVHISSGDWLKQLTEEVPNKVWKLADAFWPGPLTMVLKASDIVPRVTTGGLDTVAIRMPSHRVALALIRESGVPIAAPSANLAGRPSPTTAEHVIEDLAGRIDLILDAGPTKVGVESTVIDLTTEPPMILRPGGTTYEELREVLERLDLHPSVQTRKEVHIERALSPGMKYRHYAPKAEVVLFEGRPDDVVRKIREVAKEYMSRGKKVGILAFDESRHQYKDATVKSMGERINLKTAANRVFGLLRELDEEGVDVILAEGMAEKGLGLAVMNRLRKASGYRIIEA